MTVLPKLLMMIVEWRLIARCSFVPVPLETRVRCSHSTLPLRLFETASASKVALVAMTIDRLNAECSAGWAWPGCGCWAWQNDHNWGEPGRAPHWRVVTRRLPAQRGREISQRHVEKVSRRDVETLDITLVNVTPRSIVVWKKKTCMAIR